MKTINFMDLSRQCASIKEEVFAALNDVYDNTAFVGGGYVKAFEQEFAQYIGTKYCSGVSNGTDALFLACKAAGIKDGDEVIVPSNTFIASAWAPLHCGARVVFADCQKEDWLIDPESIESLITPKTKAVIAVHLYGQPADAKKIREICDAHKLVMIEDCAQSHGAKYDGRNVGTFGDMACFSFYPGKNLGAFGDAGAVVSDNAEYIERINMLKDHGCKVRYHHDIPGYNMRLDGFQAAVLSVKLKHLDAWTSRRCEIATKYDGEIKNELITINRPDPKSSGVHHLYAVLADDRDRFMAYMKDHGINCGIHYPIPCHLQKAFAFEGYKSGDLPATEDVMSRCVSLPMYPELTDDEVDYVIKTVNEYR